MWERTVARDTTSSSAISWADRPAVEEVEDPPLARGQEEQGLERRWQMGALAADGPLAPERAGPAELVELGGQGVEVEEDLRHPARGSRTGRRPRSGADGEDRDPE